MGAASPARASRRATESFARRAGERPPEPTPEWLLAQVIQAQRHALLGEPGETCRVLGLVEQSLWQAVAMARVGKVAAEIYEPTDEEL